MTPTSSTRIAGFVLVVLLSLLAVWRSAIGTAQEKNDGGDIHQAMPGEKTAEAYRL